MQWDNMNTKPQTQIDSSEQIIVSRQQFSGPIPPPEALKQYDIVVPGLAERIMKMAENEAASRLRNDDKLVDNIVRSSFLGIFFAFASVVLLAALACLALINDYPVVASGTVVIIASVAGMFILFRNRKNKNNV